MPRVIIRPRAQIEIDEILGHIAEDNVAAAVRVSTAIERSFERLAIWPRMGTRRRARHPSLRGLRSYPVPRYRNYLIFYIPLDDGIDVVHVIHGARDIPTMLRNG